MATHKSTRERFEEKIERIPFSTCWIWTGASGANGYGRVTARQQCHSAHRLAWLLFRGDIPAGLHVLHTCDVRCCVNPEHLFLGTVQDNSDDMVQKRRQTFGTRHPMVKLNDDAVREIRRLMSEGAKGERVARQFSVSGATISLIHHGKIWKHVAP